MIIDNLRDALQKLNLIDDFLNEKVIYFNVQNIADYLFKNIDDNIKEKSYDDYHCVTPPWDKFYISFKTPNNIGFSINDDKCYTKEDHTTINKGTEFVSYVRTHKSNDVFIIRAIFFSCGFYVHDMKKFDYIGHSDIKLSIEGKIESSEHNFPNEVKDLNERVPNFMKHLENHFYLIEDVLFKSMEFCNCKNITKKNNYIDERIINKRAKLNRIPVTKYYTLEIDNKTKDRANKSGIGGWSNSAHICRGHFKHYTEEAPLFGHYTGTVWCPMHLKGDENIGTIKKDYKI